MSPTPPRPRGRRRSGAKAAAGILLALCGPGAAARATPEAPHLLPEAAPWDITDLTLEDLLEVDRLVTIATKTRARAAEAPSIVTVIPRSVIEAYGYRTVGEALASVPGLYLVDDLVTANVGIRGVNGGPDSWSRIVKVMVDGHPVTHHASGGYLLGFELVPMDAVESIEVIRGPASGLYGANAFLGVINIVTRTAPAGAHFELGAEAGRVGSGPSAGGSLLASVSAPGRRKGALLVAVAGERADRSGLAPPSESPRADLAGRRSAGDLSQPRTTLIKGIFDLGAGGRLELRYQQQRLDAHAQWLDMSVMERDNRLVVLNRIGRLDHRIDFLAGALSWRSVASITSGRSQPEEVLDVGVPVFTLRRTRSNLAVTGATELLWQIGVHSALAGVDFVESRDQGDTLFQVRRLDDGTGRAGDAALLVRGEPRDYRNAGLFLQSMVQVLPSLELTLNGRADRDRRWGTELSYRLAGVYRARDDVHVKLLWGTSYVPPSLSQLHAQPLRIDNGITGNPDLVPQTARTGEAAVTFRLEDRLSVALNAFFTSISDRVEFVKVGSQNVARNFTPTHTLGGELSVEGRHRRFFGKLDLSLQRTTVVAPDPVPAWFELAHGSDAEMAMTLPNYPRLMGHLHAGAAVPEARVVLASSLFLAGRRKTTVSNILEKGASYTFAPYATLGFNVRTQELRLLGERLTTFSLHVSNALGARYAHGGTLGVDVPTLGRTLYLRVVQGF